MTVLGHLIPIVSPQIVPKWALNPIVKSLSYNNKLLHMCSKNNSIKQIVNNKIRGRCENTGEGVLLTIGSAEGVKNR